MDASMITDSPTIETAEKAAAVKSCFEIHYSMMFSTDASPRSLRRRAFEQHLINTPLTDMQRARAMYEFYQHETAHLRSSRVLRTSSAHRHVVKGIEIAGYQAVRVLGKGSFGIVQLVMPQPAEDSVDCIIAPERSSVFAMKIIRKSNMLRNAQEAHLRAERDFLVKSEGSRWIVPLLSSFQDNTNLYLVMDYMPGGDFLGLLLREDMLDEHITKWYIAEMILCIEETHRLGWIHRDIKPDNFLISASGHLKISDFGLSFDGHWSHTQSYYNCHRYMMVEDLRLSVRGDSSDMSGSASTSQSGTSDKLTHRRKDRLKVQPPGLLAWRDRIERRRLARSVVGTSQYMAPEVILGQPYDARCD